MNKSILDQLHGGFPEVIEEYLELEREHGLMKRIAFNRRGTLLAAGCNDGSCVIWDFLTRGVAKELRDDESSSPITSICWSKYGNRILVSAVDQSLSLWDVLSGKRIRRIVLQQSPIEASLHPAGSSKPYLCLVCPLPFNPMIVDLNTENTMFLKVSVSEKPSGPNPTSHNESSAGSICLPSAACFSKYGNLVYAGNSKGQLLIIDCKDGEVRGVVPISGGSVVKDIVFSRNRQYLLANSCDRVIRLYENLLPPKDEVRALDELDENVSDLKGVEKLKAIGAKCLILLREYRDAITNVQWKSPCFSGDGEWVVGGSATRGEHKIYIWDRAGHLMKILEGPKDSLVHIAWHPVRPIVVSVSMNGKAYIWAKNYTESWSAFAPDFIELEENEEYVEREDEFDLNPKTEKVKRSVVDEDEEVDIMTVEKDPAFSDSDMSEEELWFLPVSPIPDVPEQQDKFFESSSKPVDSNSSGSQFSEESVTNRLMMNHASSATKDGAVGTHRLKERGNHPKRCWSCRQKKSRNPLNLANHQEPKRDPWLMRMLAMVLTMMIFLMSNIRF